MGKLDFSKKAASNPAVSKEVQISVPKVRIRQIKNNPEFVVAMIGMKTKSDNFGTILVPKSDIQDTESENVKKVPITTDKVYTVAFGAEKHKAIQKMSGQEIVQCNRMYAQEVHARRMMSLENRQIGNTEHSGEAKGKDL